MKSAYSFLGALGLGLAALATINVTSNLGHAFRADYGAERAAADIVGAGKFLVGNRELKLIALQAFLIEKQQRPPEVAVFGSSRAMQIGAGTMALRGRLLNHAVDTALLETHMGLFALYDRKGIYPANVVLALDPWIFATPMIDQGFRPIFAALAEFSRKLGRPLAPDQVVPSWGMAELFSLPRAYAAFTVNRPGACTELRAGDTETGESKTGDCALRRPDMTLRYPAEWRARTAQAVEAAVALNVQRRGRLHGFDNFNAIDETEAARLHAFIRYLKDKGVNVDLVLMPYHPVVAESLAGRKDWMLVQAAEARVRAIGAELGAAVHGAYDAGRAGCPAAEFFDEMHARPACVRRVVDAIRLGF